MGDLGIAEEANLIHPRVKKVVVFICVVPLGEQFQTKQIDSQNFMPLVLTNTLELGPANER